ncbi:hypothetical protein CONLIGDRAFT_665675 [Coniochaeta ligniaria NRRL 30616]|uniref:Ribosomal protein L9 domain-containing protein n=1 Tax=Coniochaeta ligniaria NRRL 30616 TaxID=1408157 RepID=A0A1J7J5E2_9PEZI|nr:hypothetical protein CONLIGDRAFT_665675 [Coniochaeta ligniaria NRRL 30616]
MAAPIFGRTPTCLNCIRRLITTPASSPLASSSTTWTAAPISPFSFSRPQIRNKSKHHYDEGVIVRLLEDIPRYGRKDAIFRVDRGRMRNLWYPKNKAEYMTAQRFAELGLSRKDDVGEREHDFRAHEKAGEAVDEEPAPAPKMTAAEEAVSAYTLATLTRVSMQPERIHALLSTLIVPTLTFHRKPIPAPPAEPEAPPQRRSPLLAQHVLDIPTEAAKKQPEAQAIFGSVSTTDILLAVKSDLALDPEASRITLDARGIRFLGLEEDADRVKSLGSWEVEIAVPGASKFTPEVQFVRRTVEVLPAEDVE